ncbi:hypothetical protein H5410_014527 [Solanum commersonii]|uniref:Uncharacterized protein n=1 Tax=Solanum commersonii TaxID=4109 RepID=A0A9J5ZRQ4_SOLCO|nr:hypothetical protein H5410_014527 [Solanum commersonii]
MGSGNGNFAFLGSGSPNKAKNKKSRRLIDPEDILGFLSSASECITHDTYLWVVPFGTADPRAYYPNYRRPAVIASTALQGPTFRSHCRARPLSASRLSVGTPSLTSTSLQLSAMRIRYSSSEQLDVVANTPPLTQHFMHPSVSPTPTPSSTPDKTSTLALGT